MPARADNISIDLDTTAVTLQRSGNLYKHNSSVRVHNSNTYGFTLSMNADQPNLVNDKASTYKIDSVSGTNQHLAANQWGYGMGKNATTFSSVFSATLADVTSDSKGNCTSVDDCTLYLTFGANLDPKHLPTGSYSTGLTYTATSKPAPYVPPTPAPEPPAPAPYVPPEPPKPNPEYPNITPKLFYITNKCRDGDRDSSCIISSHPLSYAANSGHYLSVYRGDGGNWFVQSSSNNNGLRRLWYDYNSYTAHWAHAVICNSDKCSRYNNWHTTDKEDDMLDLNDVAAMFVYVPKYYIKDHEVTFCEDDIAVDEGGSGEHFKYRDCGDSLMDGIFSSYHYRYRLRYGFWINMADLCDIIPGSGSYESSYLYHDEVMLRSSYEYALALSTAKTLVEAIGSPCY